MAIFNPNMPLDEKLIRAMIQQSGAPEELAEITNQRRLAELVGKNALEYNPNLGKGTGAKANIGGFAGALGQGMQGYLMGSMQNKATSALDALKIRSRDNREQYLRSLYDSAMPTPMSDSGVPTSRVLPPDDEEMYGMNAAAGYPY